jgi:UDP-N-acetylglucosamine 2-epimerase (non-hydrolysing)
MSLAQVVLTDSGGIQEETTILGVPCITLRDNTERPVTLTHGTNVLVGSDCKKIIEEFGRVVQGRRKTPPAPQLWDGNAARRIIRTLVEEETRSAGLPLRSGADALARIHSQHPD